MAGDVRLQSSGYEESTRHDAIDVSGSSSKVTLTAG